MDKNLSTRFREIEEVKKNWGWFFLMGLLLIALGIAAMSSAIVASLFSIILFGFFLIAAGVVQIAQALLARKWSGLFLSLMLGVLYIITGFFCIARPEMTAVTLSLWIAMFFLAIGLFRMLASVILRFDEWGWVFFNGLVTFALGWMIYADWPISGLWIIGVFVGVDMILSGWSWIILALTARKAKELQ